jgi:hypothetical protein
MSFLNNVENLFRGTPKAPSAPDGPAAGPDPKDRLQGVGYTGGVSSTQPTGTAAAGTPASNVSMAGASLAKRTGTADIAPAGINLKQSMTPVSNTLGATKSAIGSLLPAANQKVAAPGAIFNTNVRPVVGGSITGQATTAQGNAPSNGITRQAPPAVGPGATQSQAAKNVNTEGAAANDIDKLYQDMMSRANDQWGITQNLNQQNMAMMQRKAAAMQGSMGRSVAGGFAGAMGAAYVGGMQNMNAAAAQHEQALNSLSMNYLQAKQAEEHYQQTFEAQQTQYQNTQYAGMDSQSKVTKAMRDDKATYDKAYQAWIAAGHDLNGWSGGMPGDPATAAQFMQFLMQAGYQPQ